MAKRSTYEVEAWIKVRNWDKVCKDSGRGGIVRAKWTGGYGSGGGREGDSEYEDHQAVENAIPATNTEKHRAYFHQVAQYGQGFMESLRKTTDEERQAWRFLVQQLAFKIRENEQNQRDSLRTDSVT